METKFNKKNKKQVSNLRAQINKVKSNVSSKSTDSEEYSSGKSRSSNKSVCFKTNISKDEINSDVASFRGRFSKIGGKRKVSKINHLSDSDKQEIERYNITTFKITTQEKRIPTYYITLIPCVITS